MGCNQVYDLDETEPPIDPVRLDDDADTIADADDNCPHDANLDQADDDVDGVGNVCDNCPVIPNTEQDIQGDADDVGDACDPHPVNDGDCLVVFDSFADPSTFATEWERLAGSQTADVRAESGYIALTPTVNTTLAFTARIAPAAADVQLRARVDITTGRIGAIAHASSNASYECALLRNTNAFPAVRATASMANFVLARDLSSRPIDNLATLRLVTERADTAREVYCRADYGVAVGASGIDASYFTGAVAGTAGFLVVHDRAEIDAIAIYEYRPGSTCPTEVRR